MFFLTFQIRRKRKYQSSLIKTRFLNTSGNPADPPDPAEMEHEVRLPTHQQRAKGQDDGSLNKLPQIKTGRSPMAHDHFKTPPDPKKANTNPKMIQKDVKAARSAALNF